MTLPAFGVSLEGSHVPSVGMGRPHRTRLVLEGVRGVVLGPHEWIRSDGDAIEVGWGGSARFRVQGPPSPRAGFVTQDDPRTAGLSFVISVLPLVLPLFDLEPLHGSAVVVDSCAIALLGARGAGKSSMAAALVADGATFLTDDACAFDSDGFLWPGSPLLAARNRAAREIGAPIGSCGAKEVVMVARHDPVRRSLSALVFLDPVPGSALQFARVKVQETLRMLLANVRAPAVLPERRRSLQLRVVAALSSVPTWSARFDPAAQDYKALAAAVGNLTGDVPTAGQRAGSSSLANCLK